MATITRTSSGSISAQVRRATGSIRREMKRRFAVEPVIGHALIMALAQIVPAGETV